MSSTKSRGVQGHDVTLAADELIAQGIRPTIERVRLQTLMATQTPPLMATSNSPT